MNFIQVHCIKLIKEILFSFSKNKLLKILQGSMVKQHTKKLC